MEISNGKVVIIFSINVAFPYKVEISKMESLYEQKSRLGGKQSVT